MRYRTESEYRKLAKQIVKDEIANGETLAAARKKAIESYVRWLKSADELNWSRDDASR